MTLPAAALKVWARAIASERLVRTGATRHMVPFGETVDLDDFANCDWPDAGFTAAKLTYLRRRYPPNDLPADGCIATMRHAQDDLAQWCSASSGNPHRLVYRRVDVTRGWLADVLYLRRLGWRGPCSFECGPLAGGGVSSATLHAVNASAVAPAVYASGLWRGASPVIARTLRRAVVHRLERRHEARAATRRVNDWAHRVATPDAMRALVEELDRLTGHAPLR